MGAMVGGDARILQRHTHTLHQSRHLCRDLRGIPADRRNGSSNHRLWSSDAANSERGALSGRQGICRVPETKGNQVVTSPGLLCRSPCGCGKPRTAHSGRIEVQIIFSHREAHFSTESPVEGSLSTSIPTTEVVSPLCRSEAISEKSQHMLGMP